MKIGRRYNAGVNAKGSSPSLTIGQLARAAAVPTSTVRFYERAGLLKPAARSGSNYRVYSKQSLERLQFIRSAQAVGLSLEDIAGMLEAAHGSSEPCAAVVALAERRLAEVRQKLEHLKTVERTLAKAVKGCCTDADGLCNRVTHLKNLCRPA
jgi:MerR family mercuric resistance operon transcriptional regulator